MGLRTARKQARNDDALKPFFRIGGMPFEQGLSRRLMEVAQINLLRRRNQTTGFRDTKRKALKMTENGDQIQSLAELAQFEFLAYSRQHQQAFNVAVQILANLNNTYSLIDYTRFNFDMEAIKNYAGRFQSAFTALITDPALDITKLPLGGLFGKANAMFRMIGAQPKANVDHTIAAITSSSTKMSGNAFIKCLCFIGYNSQATVDHAHIRAYSPVISDLIHIANLNGFSLFTERADKRRNESIKALTNTNNLNHLMKYQAHELVSGAWMNVSYATDENRHLAKKTMNRFFRDLFIAAGVTDDIRQLQPLADKPKVMVIFEIYHNNHAMQRCYEASLKALAKKYTLVGLQCGPILDDETKALFSEIRFAESMKKNGSVNMPMLRDYVVGHKPDIIFYPSIGMNLPVIALANFRLAPIQIAGLGHPATTHIPTIDYVIAESNWIRNPDLYSEKILELPVGAIRATRPPASEKIEVNIRQHPEVIRLAVPAAGIKISHDMIKAFKEIERRSSKKVEFIFFPNMLGLNYLEFSNVLLQEMPGAVCYPLSDYNNYIKRINDCDIHMGSFPFGGMNSLIDSLYQALPLVAMENDEPHGSFDGDYVKRAGLPDYLVARTVENYIQAALKLIEDDEERVRLSVMLSETDLDAIFATPNSSADAILQAFESTLDQSKCEK
ncbi:MAG: hypothetical protein H7A00_15685 [Hahellaceae bacterium]|nr:hypothetical protein [Hahellaceae bacterium]